MSTPCRTACVAGGAAAAAMLTPGGTIIGHRLMSNPT
jgi:hypothetical protein